MAFRILYQALCNVTIRHGYHLNEGSVEFDDLPADRQARLLSEFDAFEDLRLLATPDTQRIMAGLDLIVKALPTGFVIAAGVDEVGPDHYVPKRLPRSGFRLRFLLQARAPHFWNYTNLDFGPREQSIFYLSNRVGLEGGRFPFLSAPALAHVPGTTYPVGSLVRDTTFPPVTYVASNTGAHAAPTPANDDWIQLGARNYLGAEDSVRLRAPVFTLPLEQADLVQAQVNLDEPDGTVHDMGQSIAAPGETVGDFQVDARKLSAGRYLLRVTGTRSSGAPFALAEGVYLDPDLPAQDVFALVELFHEPGELLGTYRLYDEGAGHRLRQPEYRLLLLNRHTHWRYLFREPPPGGTPLGDLEIVDGDFVTQDPLPLTRGVQEVEFGAGKLLPNPSVQAVKPENDRVYSDVHVHINP